MSPDFLSSSSTQKTCSLDLRLLLPSGLQTFIIVFLPVEVILPSPPPLPSVLVVTSPFALEALFESSVPSLLRFLSLYKNVLLSIFCRGSPERVEGDDRRKRKRHPVLT